MKTIIEPFKIKSAEPIRMATTQATVQDEHGVQGGAVPNPTPGGCGGFELARDAGSRS